MKTFFFSNHYLTATLLSFYSFILSVQLPAQSVTGAHEMTATLRGRTQPLRTLLATQTPGMYHAIQSPDKDFEFELEEYPSAHENASGENAGANTFKNINEINGFDATVLSVIEGIDEAEANSFGRPDVNGDAGRDYYIQIVNSTWFRLFNKDGSPASDMINTKIFWENMGIEPKGDPVILYDESTERWFIGEIAGPTRLLIAVTVTSDPLGEWYLYSADLNDVDYPKFGVWPGAFIFSANNSFLADYPLYAINKQQLTQGALNVDIQIIGIPKTQANALAVPMDWNGRLSPPGNEMYFTRLINDTNGTSGHLEIWSLKVDWNNPKGSVAQLSDLPVSPYYVGKCAFSGLVGCIPQPGTNVELAGFSGLPLYKAVYHNFGGYEAAVLVFFIDSNSFICGARWVELRRYPAGQWAVYQEGTVAADDREGRFLGSIAMNARGDIGLGYLASGDSTYLSLRFTGRLAGDSTGQMTVNEYEFATGSAAHTSSSLLGDYTAMNYDPVDDSFWYTGVYMKGPDNFGTKIVNFKIRTDSADISPVALNAPLSSDLLSSAEPVTVTVKNFGVMPVSGFKVGYRLDNGPFFIENAAIGALNPGEIYTHTFAATADCSVPGDHRVQLFTTLEQDGNPSNDTLDVTRQKIPHLDAGVTRVATDEAEICTAVVKLKADLLNFGLDTIYTLTLQYQINNNPVESLTWNGVLLPGGGTTVSFDAVNFEQGFNTVTVRTANPNGLQDERTDNDSNIKEILNFGQFGEVTLTITTDNAPEETSWELYDDSGALLHKGGPYTGLPDSTIKVQWCLHPGECYRFEFFDSAGNGLAAPGNFVITQTDGTILAKSNPLGFLYFEQKNFCFSTSCDLTTAISVTNLSAPGANDGTILVVADGGFPPYLYSRNNGVTWQPEPLFTGLTPAAYKIAVKDVVGCVLKKNVVVQSTVDVTEPIRAEAMSLAPNPSENGMVQISISSTVSTPGNFRVMDALGRTVASKPASINAGNNTIPWDLSRLHGGYYWLVWQTEKTGVVATRFIIFGD